MSSEKNNWKMHLLDIARQEAIRLGNDHITTDHLLLALLRDRSSMACRTLAEICSLDQLKSVADRALDTGASIPQDEQNRVVCSDSVDRAYTTMDMVGDFHSHGEPFDAADNLSLKLLVVVLTLGEQKLPGLFRPLGVTSQAVVDNIDLALGIRDDAPAGKGRGSAAAGGESPKKNPRDDNSPLKLYGRDLTEAALSGKLDPVVGRGAEIERVIQILGRRKKNNPVLIGEPGVGKSAIAEGLAARIANRQVPRTLLDRKVVMLDIGSIVAGTKFRGQFEERIKDILSELKTNPGIILFIDELHTLVGAGGAPGSLDAANMLKPALARGEIQCIGATTLDEYRKVIEKDGALERRFQKVMVEPTSYEDTIEILREIKPLYEKHHNVTYTDEAVKACVHMARRYITDRALPDKAIDVMDEVGSRVHLKYTNAPEDMRRYELQMTEIRNAKRDAAVRNDFRTASEMRLKERELSALISRKEKEFYAGNDLVPHIVDEENVAETISAMTGIVAHKVAQDETERLLRMNEIIKRKIVGQDEAVDKVCRAIRRNRAGLKDPGKPIGTFMFLGPTGVGKTRLANVLAEYLFDSADSIIRIDMSEYTEKISATRLTGAPPGYVGYDQGGELSERVRRKPYSVVLLDEIEKAHSDIFNILLQVLDEGRLTDANGNHVDFRNTIVIMTSNVGSRELKDFGGGLGFATPARDAAASNDAIIDKALNKVFSPEFLNRLDDQIFFNALTRSDIRSIVDIELDSLLERTSRMGYKVEVVSEVRDFLADVGFDPRYGARPLKRAIQKYVEDPLSEAIINTLASSPSGFTVTLSPSGNDTSVSAM